MPEAVAIEDAKRLWGANEVEPGLAATCAPAKMAVALSASGIERGSRASAGASADEKYSPGLALDIFKLVFRTAELTECWASRNTNARLKLPRLGRHCANLDPRA
jgi:hypothetical protein